MDSIVTFEGILRDKLAILDDLKLATVLLGHRDTLREQLFEAKLVIDSIMKSIDEMKNDLARMKAQNDYCRNMSLSLKQLEAKIVYMSENLPPEFIQDFQLANEESSPHYQSSEIASMVASDKDTAENTVTEQMLTLNLNTPEPGIAGCKKMLFKNMEDAYILDLLSEDEFSRIPKYMIGRQSIAALNEFVATINAILEAKYGLLALGKVGARKKGKLDLYLSLKREEIVVAPGEDPVYFFTAEDYQRHTQTRLDKTKLNLLTVLRHCKRLRELRVGKNLQYVLVSARERCKSGMFG